MRDDSSDRIPERYRKMMKKLRQREQAEQYQPRERGGARRGSKPKRSRDHALDDDAPDFESMAASRRGRGRRPHRDLKDAAACGVLVALHRTVTRVELDGDERDAMLDKAMRDPDRPLAVGDVVHVADRGGALVITAVEPRRTVLARPDPGRRERPRVIAANVDVVVIVIAADAGLKLGLADRVMVALGDDGARPLLCINKVDRLDDAARTAIERSLAPYRDLGVEVVLASAATGEGTEALRAAVRGLTIAMVGQSGAGKSSLLNRLDPDGRRATAEVRRHDRKGRHTTTSSCFRRGPDGTAFIDTPGVREFGLWVDKPAVRRAFPELTDLGCRFRDCRHTGEDGCVADARAEAGALASLRLASYRRILASLAE